MTAPSYMMKLRRFLRYRKPIPIAIRITNRAIKPRAVHAETQKGIPRSGVTWRIVS